MDGAHHGVKRPNAAVHADKQGFGFFEAIGRFSIHFRWLIVIVWLAGTMLIVHNLPSLTSVTQSDNSAFLPTNAPSSKAIALASAFGQSDFTPIPVLIGLPGTGLTPQDQQSISRLETRIEQVGDVKKVESVGVSADGQAVELVALVGGKVNGSDPSPFIDSLRVAIKTVALPAGMQVHLAGDIATQVDNSKQSGSTNQELQLASVVFIILLLLVIFRAPLAPLITLIPPLLVVTISGPLIAEASKAGLKVSSLAQLLLTVLVLGAGTDYGLFLIFRVREETRAGLSSREAIVKAMGRVGESITFSAATVIAALLSLLVATFQIYSDLGIPLAIGIALMLFAGLTLLPALLSIFGRAAFWPSKRTTRGSSYGLWGRICARVVQHPVLTLVIGAVFFGGLALAVPGYQAGGFGGTTTAPAGSDSAAGNALLAKHFPNSSANPTEMIYVLPQSVWQNPRPLVTGETLLKQSALFTQVAGALNPNGAILTPTQFQSLYKKLGPPQKLSPFALPGTKITPALYQTYRASANYITADGKTVAFAVSLRAGDPETTAAMKAVPAIRVASGRIARAMGAVNSGVAGEAPAFYDISNISNQDLMRVVPIAILVIGILLGFLLRSLIAPLYLVASVAVSYLAALGLVVFLFIDLNPNNNGIVFILPFLMFLFLLALGEDYNIIVMTRIREEAHHLPLKQAVTRALNTTGTTVTSAGLVLAGTFTVLGIVGGAGEIRDIGFGLAAGILMDTFLVRTLLVPAIVVLLGRWNWWPSKHGAWTSEKE